MQRTNISFLKLQLESILLETFSEINLNEIKFQIEFDFEEKQEPRTNFDEIMYHWSLPKHFDRDLVLNQVCEFMVTAHNEIPLWIKISTLDKSLFRLSLSKRFRKKSIIDEWHKENIFKPFLISQNVA